MRLSTACTVLSAVTSTSSVVVASVVADTESSHHEQQRTLQDIIAGARKTSTSMTNPRRNEKERLSYLLSQRRQEHELQQLEEIGINIKRSGVLRNGPSSSSSSTITGTTKQQQQECDPMSSESNDGADVGVLSCGLGQYCKQSLESTLGGYCVSDDDDAVAPVVGRGRDLQQGDGMILNDIVNFCQGTTEIGQRFGGGELTCETCAIDAAKYTGQLNCTYTEFCYELGGLCPEDTETTTFCESTTVEANLTGPDEYSYRVCNLLHEPKNWTYCVTYTAEPDKDTTCEITIDGTTCNSCTVRSSNCKEFDCENTKLGTSSSTCGYNLLESYTASYLYDQLPCDNGCNLCPEGEYMANPDSSFIASSGSITNCFVAQLSALTGEYSRNQCTREAARVSNCNCTEPAPTPAPSGSSSSKMSYPQSIAAVSIVTTSVMTFLGLAADGI